VAQTSMNHAELNVLLRDSFRQHSPVHRNVRIPSEADIRFCGDLACMKVWMSAIAVQANMQDDRAAFEGWSLVPTWSTSCDGSA
jgi:hypothetical protein